MENNLRFLAALRDIVEYGNEAMLAIENLTFQNYKDDRKTRLLVERCLSIVGEASVRIRNVGESERLSHT
jgi:uncharacterized protein with HEPN domain